jgi:pyruvate formate lyase activating enzyme
MSASPLVLDIKGNALDDGPGVRSVVFFKGCLLSCVWCHNPEGVRKGAELSFDADRCVDARSCIAVCEAGALSKSNPLFVDRDKCTLCYACVEACPSLALTRVGEPMPVAALVEKLLRYKGVYDASGGGVTLSGGEPTIHMEYVSELLQQLKSNGIHTLLQTAGLFPFGKFMQLVYPHLDMIHFDLKLFDAEAHRRYCGVTNETILDNFRKLHEHYRDGGVELLARTPLVPGITDTPANLAAIAGFLNRLGVARVQLMSYNPLWHDKSVKLGIAPKMCTVQDGAGHALDAWMSRDQLQACEDVFRAAGLQTGRGAGA